MQFEGNEIDKKLKEAADNHYPLYNDGAWKKMESLLDKHLPQRKEKRRIMLFLLLFLLLGGGGVYLLVSKPWNPDRSTDITQKDQIQTDPLKANRRNTDNISENLSSRSGNDEDAGNSNQSPLVEQPLTIQLNRKQYVDAAQKMINNRIKKIIEPSQLSEMKTELKDESRKEETKIIAGVNDLDINSEHYNNIKKEEQKTSVEQGNTVLDESKSIVSPKSNKQKKNNSFFISISTGPDVSSIGISKPGKTKLLGGVGLGYTFNDRFTLRTGFYTARKIYSAGKGDYKPEVVPPNYIYLENISADCKVYEVPLGLTYHFGRTANQNFFASAGLSSYFMKKEVYDYNYKYPSNVTYSHRYSFNNENNHYFSVAGFSVGYQRNINKTFSLIAEPYIRIPLNGVGNGNVRLNSGGILFSATVKPFQNSSKPKKPSLPVKTGQ